jgi:phosphate transport system substrate-binding protein
MIETVADYTNYKDSLGFSFRFFTNEMVGNRDIKLLDIDGITPNIENIANGKYPLSSNFYAVTLEDTTNPNVQKLLDWIVSPQGQKLVEKVGYVGV